MHSVSVMSILTGVHFAIRRPVVSGALQKRLLTLGEHPVPLETVSRLLIMIFNALLFVI